MKTKIKVNVTQAAINRAVKAQNLSGYDSITECIVAQSLLSRYPRIRCGMSGLRLKGRNSPVIPLSEDVANNIYKFCQREKVEPFSFILNVPAHV